MFRRKEPQTLVVDYENAKERDKGIQEMAKKGYAVVNVAVYPGKTKKGKAILTGGLGFLTPGGLHFPERYAVTFSKLPPPPPPFRS